MSKWSWEAELGLTLVLLSVLVYALKLAVVGDPADSVSWVLNSLGFLPINILLVTLIVDRLLSLRDRRTRLDKLNMVIGTFFSEIGQDLLRTISSKDRALHAALGELAEGGRWSRASLDQLSARLSSHSSRVSIRELDMEALRAFLESKRDFLLRLLENPMLLEHESFTETLRALFHLVEELCYRGDLGSLPDSDYAHLSKDLNRAYSKLVTEWLDYMRYLERSYPYLHSLAERTNPFDQETSVVVTA